MRNIDYFLMNPEGATIPDLYKMVSNALHAVGRTKVEFDIDDERFSVWADPNSDQVTVRQRAYSHTTGEPYFRLVEIEEKEQEILRFLLKERK